MLYKFKSKATGDVIMTTEVGDRLMKVLGREPAAQGIFLPGQMPAAIATLEQAVAAEEDGFRRAAEEAAAEGRKLPPVKGVTLRQRTWPLIDMMKRAQAAGEEIVWGV
jgi:hypothetical protein